jgi:hypothetical protein
VRQGLAEKSVPQTRADAVAALSQNGEAGLTPLAQQALDVWEKLDEIERHRKAKRLNEACVACVALGIMCRDFEDASRGKHVSKMHDAARIYYLQQKSLGKIPTAKQVIAHLEKLEYKTKAGFSVTYSRWRKKWDRLVAS